MFGYSLGVLSTKPVNFAAVTDANNQNYKFFVSNLVNYSVISRANAVEFETGRLELLASVRSRNFS